MAIWIVTEIYYPEETSTGYLLTKIAEGISSAFPVNVLTGPPDYSGDKVNCSKREVRNGVVIERCQIASMNKNHILLRIIRSLTLAIAISGKAVFRIKPGDIVLVVTNPAPLLFIMSAICKWKKTKIVVIVHDIFPDNLPAAGIIPSNSRILKILGFFSRRIYNNADKIVVIGRDMAEIIKKKIKNRHDRIEFIPNWCETDNIRPLPRNKNDVIERLGLQRKFIVQFAGNLGRVQGLDPLVDAVKKLAKDNIHLLLAGNGARKDAIQRRVIAESIGNITILDSYTRQEQGVLLNACDVGIVSLKSGMYGLGVPSKVYNIMAAGKAIIAMVDYESEVGLLIREESIGWVVRPGSVDELIAAILEAKVDQKRLAQMGSKARWLAEHRFTLEHSLFSYRKIIQSLA